MASSMDIGHLNNYWVSVAIPLFSIRVPLTVPGKAFEAELENADGYLGYRVGIVRDNHQIADVKVDVGNSKVLNIEGGRKAKEYWELESHDANHEGRDNRDKVER